MLAEFCLTCIFHHVWENCLNLWCSHYGVLDSKLQAEFFENLFPPTVESGGGNYDLLYQNSIRKYEDPLEH